MKIVLVAQPRRRLSLGANDGGSVPSTDPATRPSLHWL
jgi:hypothetical protein